MNVKLTELLFFVANCTNLLYKNNKDSYKKIFDVNIIAV